MVNIYSWNVNGLRAAVRHGFLDWLEKSGADMVCLQEVKARPEDVPELTDGWGPYRAFWKSGDVRGYSGVMLLTREEPLGITDMQAEEFDREGRVLVAEYEKFTLVTAYFPNSQEAGKRLDYKLAFCGRMRALCDGLRGKGKNIVLCGDYNIAHKPIDLANPKQNEGNPGYLPEERAWMDAFTAGGYADTFRMFDPGAEKYTWWSYRGKAREKNVGWRIDYHCVNDEFRPRVVSARIHADITGSDHCPVSVALDI